MEGAATGTYKQQLLQPVTGKWEENVLGNIKNLMRCDPKASGTTCRGRLPGQTPRSLDHLDTGPLWEQTSSVVGTVPGLPQGARDSICSATASCTADHRQFAWSMASMACLPAAMFCKVRNGVSGPGKTRRQEGHDWSTMHAGRLFVTIGSCRVTLPPRDEDGGEDEDGGRGRKRRAGGVLGLQRHGTIGAVFTECGGGREASGRTNGRGSGERAERKGEGTRMRERQGQRKGTEMGTGRRGTALK